ncbi:hypothetical protein [Streptomyces zhihengii]
MPGERGAGRAVLRAAVAGQRRRVVTASLLGMGHQACEVLVPVVIGLVIDEAGVADDQRGGAGGRGGDDVIQWRGL